MAGLGLGHTARANEGGENSPFSTERGLRLLRNCPTLGRSGYWAFRPDASVPVPDLTEGLWGKLFGDRGYVSHELFERLQQTGIQLITKLKRRMKNKLMPLLDKLL